MPKLFNVVPPVPGTAIAPPPAIAAAPVTPAAAVIPAGWEPHPTAPGYYHNGVEALTLADLLARNTPATDPQAEKLFAGVKAGKVSGLSRDDAKKVLAVRSEKYPQVFRMNGFFEPGETDTATIVADKKGNEVRAKTGSGRSGANIYFHLRSTTKTDAKGRPVEYGISILNDDQLELGANGAIVQTVAVALPVRPTDPEGTEPTVVMNFA